jgi:hypothetical protein
MKLYIGIVSCHLLLSQVDDVDIFLELSLWVGVEILHKIFVALNVKFLT